MVTDLNQFKTPDPVSKNENTLLPKPKQKTQIEQVILSLQKIVEERNEIMKRIMLAGKHRLLDEKDRVRLTDLKREVRQLAQIVATAHSYSAFSAADPVESNQSYQDIFEQLIMCQSELTFSVEIIKNAHKGKLRSAMAILFEEEENSGIDSDEDKI